MSASTRCWNALCLWLSFLDLLLLLLEHGRSFSDGYILDFVKNDLSVFLAKNSGVSTRLCIFAGLFLLSPTAWTAQTMAHPAVSSPTTAPTAYSNLALVPMPREIHERGVLSLTRGISVSTTSRNADDAFAVTDLVDTLRDRGVDTRVGNKGNAKVILLRQNTKKAEDILKRAHISFDAVMHNEGYVLLTDGNTTYDIAATAAGLYYGAQTIKQLVIGRGSKAILHGVLIRDWPAMKYRGQDDDLSRGPVPTLKFQEHQIRVLSEYKVNIYSPYFESNLAYASNPLPEPPGGSITRAEVEQLVRYAQQYHVTIIPEQEAFGHLHHTLMFDTYSKLAETPYGNVLAPGQPGSLQLIQQWFTEIASMFPSPFIHIGGDETFELGKGQTKALVAQEGLDKVYIDFLIRIHKALQPLHKRILFWGDIAMKDPPMVKMLPKDMIAVAWTYSPQPEGFDKWLRPFVDAGLETWVAPGVNNWNRVYPDNNKALLNIQGFVRDGQHMGSTGELNTVWNDDGEGLFNQDWYGVLFGAAAGWQPGSSDIPQFQNSYGQVFHGDLTGKINQAQIELTCANMLLTSVGTYLSSDAMFFIDPWSQQGQEFSVKLMPIVHELRIHAEKAIILIDQARAAGPLRETDALDAMELGARRLDFIGYKFEAAQEIANEYDHAYRETTNPTAKQDTDWEFFANIDGLCQDLRNGYGLTRDLYRKAWLQENRPYWLDNITAQYDLAMQRWIKQEIRFDKAEHEWYQTKKLPRPEDVGLPQLAAADSGASAGLTK